MSLFDQQGYQETTIPQIVKGAGLTTRTFFRHFADKRDVLFLREREFPQVVGTTLLGAADGLSPRELVRFGLLAAARELQPLNAPIERRRRIIRANAQLRERELLQYDRLSDAIRAALVDRRAAPREALILGKLGALVLELSLEQWLTEPGQSLTDIIDATCAEILTGG